MLTKAVPLLALSLGIAYVIAQQTAGNQADEAAQVIADTRYSAQQTTPHVLHIADCGAPTASPFGRAGEECPQVQASAGDVMLTPQEAEMAQRLEELVQRGDSRARFELGLQLQRQAQRAGRALNDADVAESQELQRSIALISEAIATGNPEAQRYAESLGREARMFHTGR